MRLPPYLSHMGTETASKKSVAGKSSKAFSKVLVGLIAALFIVAPSVLHSQVGIGFSPVLTGSMRPYAHPGDLMVTKITKASNLKVGDIISIHSQDTGVFYAHRIVRISMQNGQLRIVTKGDANPTPEVTPFMVGPNQPVSRNIMRILWIGRPLVYLTSIQGRQAALSLIVIANVIALILFLFRKKIHAANPTSLHVYKDLFVEAHKAREKAHKELAIFKELFEESQMDPELKEVEMANELKVLKSVQINRTSHPIH